MRSQPKCNDLPAVRCRAIREAGALCRFICASQALQLVLWPTPYNTSKVLRIDFGARLPSRQQKHLTSRRHAGDPGTLRPLDSWETVCCPLSLRRSGLYVSRRRLRTPALQHTGLRLARFKSLHPMLKALQGSVAAIGAFNLHCNLQ